MESNKGYFIDENLEAMKKFMIERGWRGHKCGGCGRVFFAKPSTKTDVSTCGWHKCDKGGYPFRAFSKCKRLLKPSYISTKMSE